MRSASSAGRLAPLPRRFHLHNNGRKKKCKDRLSPLVPRSSQSFAGHFIGVTPGTPRRADTACDRNEIALITEQHIKPAAASPRLRPPTPHPFFSPARNKCTVIIQKQPWETFWALSYLISIICNCGAACVFFFFLNSSSCCVSPDWGSTQFYPLISLLLVRMGATAAAANLLLFLRADIRF